MNGYWTALQGVLCGRRGNSDPLYNSTILLLTGQDTLTTDSSPQANAMSTVDTIALDSTVQYGSLNTYNTAGAGRLVLSSPGDISPLLGTNEFCIEWWLRFSQFGSGGFEAWMGSAPFNAALNSSGELSMNFRAGGTSYGVNFGTLSLDTWYHVCLIRDNTTDPTDAFGRAFLDGVLVSSTGNFAKTDAAGVEASLGAVIGYYNDANAPRLACAGVRWTVGDQRYNLAGFTPDEPPFYAP